MYLFFVYKIYVLADSSQEFWRRINYRIAGIQPSVHWAVCQSSIASVYLNKCRSDDRSPVGVSRVGTPDGEKWPYHAARMHEQLELFSYKLGIRASQHCSVLWLGRILMPSVLVIENSIKFRRHPVIDTRSNSTTSVTIPWSMTHRAGALSPVTLKAMLLQTSYLFNLKLYLAHLSRPCPRNRTLDTTISKQVLQEQQHKHMMLQSQDRASIWVHLQKSANWIALRSPMEIAYLALGTVDCPGN